MGFLHPQLLLLALPAALVWYRWRGPTRAGAVVRAIVFALLVFAAAAPYVRLASPGRDLVIVADRSRSMPADADAALAEIVRLAEDERESGDRVALVVFGADAAVESPLGADSRFESFARAVDRDGSDLAGALELALALLPTSRPGSILLVSDGEANGGEPLGVARTAFARGVRIDTRPLVRSRGDDVSVEQLDAPLEVGVAEPFQVHAWIRSDRARTVEFVLERDGETLARGQRELTTGLQRWTFRDLLTRPGVAQLRLRLLGLGDAVPENDAGVAALRALGSRPVLVVDQDGGDNTLARALERAAIPVEVVAPSSKRLERLALTGARAVVLDNVPADALGGAVLSALAEFVRERGGGLLMSGGRSSFGIGGYHRSPLDEVLPVSMEMREEARKLGLAMAIALDRSGSMAVEVAPGVQKMHLANEGACAAIELLSPIDDIGVIAVDSAHHVVQVRTRAAPQEPILSRVRSIESGGGGIFCYTALLAAAKMLEDAPHAQRHIVLFADAADAEEQTGCDELIDKLARAGVTLSVVALGSKADSDAAFLERSALAGGGSCYFTTDPAELPRLFAQDTLTIARATFVPEPVACVARPDLVGLGDARAFERGFCSFDGFNVVWLREGASCGALVQNDLDTPAFAFWQHGLGRSAAFSGQIGGEFGASVVGWDGFSAFFVTLGRWLAGQEEPREVFATATRDGRLGRVRIEIDPNAPTPPDLSKLELRMSGPDGIAKRLELERVGENAFEASTPLDRQGVTLGTLSLGDGRALSLPPLMLPYSPEFEVGADPGRGERTMRTLARESGGLVAPPMAEIFRGERGAKAWRVVSRELALVALLLVMLEIAARRLELWGSLAAIGSRTLAPLARLRRKARQTPKPIEKESAPPAPASPTRVDERPATPAAAAPRPSSDAPANLDDALRRARKSAGRELDR